MFRLLTIMLQKSLNKAAKHHVYINCCKPFCHYNSCHFKQTPLKYICSTFILNVSFIIIVNMPHILNVKITLLILPSSYLQLSSSCCSYEFLPVLENSSQGTKSTVVNPPLGFHS